MMYLDVMSGVCILSLICYSVSRCGCAVMLSVPKNYHHRDLLLSGSIATALPCSGGASRVPTAWLVAVDDLAAPR